MPPIGRRVYCPSCGFSTGTWMWVSKHMVSILPFKSILKPRTPIVPVEYEHHTYTCALCGHPREAHHPPSIASPQMPDPLAQHSEGK